MKITHSWDTAIKAGKGRDASVCLVFEQVAAGPTNKNSYKNELDGDLGAESESPQALHRVVHRLVDVWLGRVEYPDLKRHVLRLAARDNPHAILIEDKASGQSLIQDLRRETNLPVIAMMPQGDKVTRLAQVSPMIESGQVALPRHANWLAAFEQEILAFPNGAHDDQVDALSQYLNWVRARQFDRIGIRRI